MSMKEKMLLGAALLAPVVGILITGGSPVASGHLQADESPRFPKDPAAAQSLELKSEEFELGQLSQGVKCRDITTRHSSHEKVLGCPIAGITVEFRGSRKLDGGCNFFGSDAAPSPAFPGGCHPIYVCALHVLDSFLGKATGA